MKDIANRGELCFPRKNAPPKKEVLYHIDLGNHNQEALDSDARGNSPQQRTVAAGTAIWIPIVVVKSNRIFVLKHADWRVFSAQAQQDLRVQLIASRSYVLYSGIRGSATTKANTDPKIESVSRSDPTIGGELNSVSSTSGAGIADNFPPRRDRFTGIAYADQLLSWHITNQSDVYAHSIQVSHYGYDFPAKGQTKGNVFGDLAK